MHNELQREFLKQRKTVSCKKSLGKLGSSLFPPESNFQNVVLFACSVHRCALAVEREHRASFQISMHFWTKLRLLMQMRWWFRLTSTCLLYIGPTAISQTFAANEIPFFCYQSRPRKHVPGWVKAVGPGYADKTKESFTSGQPWSEGDWLLAATSFVGWISLNLWMKGVHYFYLWFSIILESMVNFLESKLTKILH